MRCLRSAALPSLRDRTSFAVSPLRAAAAIACLGHAAARHALRPRCSISRVTKATPLPMCWGDAVERDGRAGVVVEQLVELLCSLLTIADAARMAVRASVQQFAVIRALRWKLALRQPNLVGTRGSVDRLV